jgi:hypothetical protein
MSHPTDKIARAITRFVENPVIGLSEASKTFTDDLVHKQLRVGHGLIIIGVFGILQALPHLIEGLEAGQEFLELRHKKARPDSGPGVGPGERSVRSR